MPVVKLAGANDTTLPTMCPQDEVCGIAFTGRELAGDTGRPSENSPPKRLTILLVLALSASKAELGLLFMGQSFGLQAAI